MRTAWNREPRPSRCRRLSPRFSIPLAVLSALASFQSASAQAIPAALVGGNPIPLVILDDAVQRRARELFFHKVDEKKLLAVKQEELQKLIKKELDVLGGLDEGLTLGLEEAERQRASIEQQLGREKYERSIALWGWTREEHARVLAREKLAATARQRCVEAPSRATDREVRDEFEKSPGRYRVEEMVWVEHILIAVQKEAGEAERREKREETARLRERIEQGEPFADLASKFSNDMYRIKGGDLGWVHRGRLLGALESAVWEAREGEVVGPIESAEGYHLARVKGRRPARQMSFDEAASAIRERLSKEKLQQSADAWYGALRQRHPVLILIPDLEPEAGQ